MDVTLLQRGRYWIKRLGNMNRDGELDDLITVIQAMISDTPAAMGNLIKYGTLGAARLIAWLKAVCQSPPLLNKVQAYDDASVIEPKTKRYWMEMFLYCDDPWKNPDVWLDELDKYPELAGSSNVLDDLIQFVRALDTPNPMLTFKPLLMLAMFQIKLLLSQQPKVPLEWQLRLNQNDNQGFRSELVNAYQRLNRDADAGNERRARIS